MEYKEVSCSSRLFVCGCDLQYRLSYSHLSFCYQNDILLGGTGSCSDNCPYPVLLMFWTSINHFESVGLFLENGKTKPVFIASDLH